MDSLQAFMPLELLLLGVIPASQVKIHVLKEFLELVILRGEPDAKLARAALESKQSKKLLKAASICFDVTPQVMADRILFIAGDDEVKKKKAIDLLKQSATASEVALKQIQMQTKKLVNDIQNLGSIEEAKCIMFANPK